MRFYDKLRREIKSGKRRVSGVLIKELGLGVRVESCCRSDGILTLADLVQRSEAEMLRTPNFGRKSLNDVKKALAALGLHFGSVVGSGRPTLKELSIAVEGLRIENQKQVEETHRLRTDYEYILRRLHTELEGIKSGFFEPLQRALSRLDGIDSVLARVTVDNARLEARDKAVQEKEERVHLHLPLHDRINRIETALGLDVDLVAGEVVADTFTFFGKIMVVRHAIDQLDSRIAELRGLERPQDTQAPTEPV